MSALPLPPARRALGQTDIEVSPLAWGMWRTAEDGRGVDDMLRLLHTALDAGITFMDTADIYGFDGCAGFGDAERLLGAALQREPALRARMLLTTKGGIAPPVPYDQSRAYMDGALDASLSRLGVDHVDLYQIHRPDILTHPQEVARFLEDAMASGKVRAIGVSNYTAAQLEALSSVLETPLATTQPEISPLCIDALANGAMDQAMRLGLTPLAWSPLGGARLINPQSKHEEAVAAALDAVAMVHDVSRAVAAYGWLMAHPAGIIPIIGSQTPERIAEAAQAMSMQWTRQEWYAVYTAARGEPLP